MWELLEPAQLTGEGEGAPPRATALCRGDWAAQGLHSPQEGGGAWRSLTCPQPELHSSPCVPGGYYLTSLSASLALLSGLEQAHTAPLSPSQELQRSLSLWEQRRLPAAHSLQVRGLPGGRLNCPGPDTGGGAGFWRHPAQSPLPRGTQQGRGAAPCVDIHASPSSRGHVPCALGAQPCSFKETRP